MENYEPKAEKTVLDIIESGGDRLGHRWIGVFALAHPHPYGSFTSKVRAERLWTPFVRT